MVSTVEMDVNEQIQEIEKKIHDRMNQLAQQDPYCNRLMGRLELLREQEEVSKNAQPTE